MIDRYLSYLSSVRRYAPRTCEIYRGVLEDYLAFVSPEGPLPWSELLSVQQVRNYEVFLMDEKGEGAKTVSLHLSVLSGFCKFLMKQGELECNPVRLVSRPKQEKRLPSFYREDAMQAYFQQTRGVMEYGRYEDKL